VERIVETHQFGPHRVAVLEHVEDEGISYSVLVDDRRITDPPLEYPPRFEDVVRIYAQSQAGG
jgi:hypothetical protein